MRCYKCNSVLSETDFCNSCGADVTIYKKIVKLANTYYNMGLEKARVRDLSGAADALRRCIKIDKNNINGRNLLGLVYYEMGESVAAFTEWVISKNIRPEKNIADEYLEQLQSNPTKLNLLNQSAKKYNASLEAVLQGSDDIAIIQLKKVVSMNPNFVKAMLLLALLYMKKGENQRASKILAKVRKIDTNNTVALKYLAEIESQRQEKSENAKKPVKSVAELNERDALSGNDVIIPKGNYKETNYGLATFITAIVGIILGAAIVYFLVVPARKNDVDAEYKDKVNNYSNQVGMLNINVSELERQVESLKQEKEQVMAELDNAKANQVDATVYNKLIEAASKYMDNDMTGCADALYDADMKGVTGEAAIAMYNRLSEATFADAAESYNNKGYQAMNTGDYETAVQCLQKASKFKADDVSIWYNLGKCYKAQNGGVNNENSIACFDKVIELEPNGDYASWAKSQKQ